MFVSTESKAASGSGFKTQSGGVKPDYLNVRTRVQKRVLWSVVSGQTKDTNICFDTFVWPVPLTSYFPQAVRFLFFTSIRPSQRAGGGEEEGGGAAE